MSIIQMSLPIPSSSSRNLSSSFRFLIDPDKQLNLLSKFSQLSLHKVVPKRGSTVIRMGGGPRTYPGGVSKWQWKRMQTKKQKQLLKGRLLRERQIYEMRKRSELRAAVSELERPWEVVERAPNLFSVKADEQLKVLADRFRKPGGYDMWSERDGPQVFHTVDGLPSTRFFPKGVVHSIKPYESLKESEELVSRELGLVSYDEEDGNERELERGSSNGSRRTKKSSNWISKGWSDSEGEDEDEGFRSSYSKNSRSLGSRGGRVGDVKRLGSANGREVSRDSNGGRGGMGSPNGGLRRNGGTGQNVESRDSNGGSGGMGSINGGLRRNGGTRQNVESRDSNRGSGGMGSFNGGLRRNGGTRQNVESRDSNGGSGGMGSFNGGLRRNGGTRQNVESRDSNWLSSEKANSDREGRNVAPFERRGRYGSNEPRQSIESRNSNWLSSEKANSDREGRNEAPFERRGRYGSNEPRQSIESRDSNWLSSEKANSDREGRNEVPFERRGIYGSNEPRQSIESRDSNLLSPEKGNFDHNNSKDGGNRPRGPRQPHGPFHSKRGNSKKPNHGEGRFGSKQRARTWRAIPPKSSVSRSKEIYDLSLIGGDSYGFQGTEQ